MIETRGSTPQTPGAAMLVYPDRAQAGTLGGGCIEAEVRRESLRVLAANYDNRWSHPVLFPWAAAKQVAQLSANETIRDLFTKNQWRGVAMSGVRPHDVDLPGDWEQNERKPEK